MSDGIEPYSPNDERPGARPGTRRHLMGAVAGLRRARRRAMCTPLLDPDCDEARAEDRRFVAAGVLERCLVGPLPRVVRAPAYLSRIATLNQLTTRRVRAMNSSVAAMPLRAARARTIAVAVTEMVHFVDAAVPGGGIVDLYFAAALEDDGLVVGLAAAGDYLPMSSAAATRGLLLVNRLVHSAGGWACRGADGDRMVFGMTFPRPDVGGL